MTKKKKYKICEHCGKEYYGRGISFCSIKCKNTYIGGKPKPSMRKPLKQHTCIKCKKEFYTKNWRKQKFCSISCGSKYNYNREKLNNEEIRKKISATLQRINIEDWKDFSQSEIQKARQSKEYNEWRKTIYKIYNYTCQICKIRGGILHAYHILKFSKFKNKRFDLNNGICLCRNCHMKITQLEKKGELYEF